MSNQRVCAADLLGPVCNRVSFTVELDPMISAIVSELLVVIYPAAIFRTVITAGVNAINFQTETPRLEHVLVEI